jgi:carbon-monoxide dehydrogenase small subunit
MKLLQPQEMVAVSFTLNGKPVSGRCPPRMHLADFLRHVLHMTGTHVGCEHGVCGACTVLVNRRAVRACLLYSVQVQDADIATIEGLEKDGKLSPLQQAFHENFALQCGFCTPGILMSAVDLLSRSEKPDERDVRELLSGHLCRCTGYEAIIAAILDAARGA